MNARLTSIETYNEIKKNGMLSRSRMEVYNILYHYGEMTATEIYMKIAEDKDNIVRDSYHQRLSELRERGVIKEVSTRKCTITDKKAIVWAVTDSLPKEVKKGMNRFELKQKLNKSIEALKAAIGDEWKAQVGEIHELATKI